MPRSPEQQKSYYQENKEHLNSLSRKHQLLLKYGLTIEDYNQMFSDQGGCCAICNKHQSEFKRRLAVDHCHATGKVRALLCHTCNLQLGFYENRKEEFEGYLSKRKK